MRTLFHFAAVLATLSLIPVLGNAQCTNRTVAFTSYGSGCTSVFNTVPSLAGKFDPTNCTMYLDLSAFGGCCNTFLRNRIFAFGVRQTSLPVPFIGPKCVLLTSSELFVVLPVAAGSTLQIPVPPAAPAGTLYAQGAAHYFTTIGLSNDYELTNGLSITLQ
ncbi:MAG: hypothetical protein KDC87_10140 [Planctomycetes bacterium]|nr:hypothetical protein [Planctomycetota bacterium]MCB9888871.1 hypothetical protein [Planctomycetota bacterium]